MSGRINAYASLVAAAIKHEIVSVCNGDEEYALVVAKSLIDSGYSDEGSWEDIRLPLFNSVIHDIASYKLCLAIVAFFGGESGSVDSSYAFVRNSLTRQCGGDETKAIAIASNFIRLRMGSVSFSSEWGQVLHLLIHDVLLDDNAKILFFIETIVPYISKDA